MHTPKFKEKVQERIKNKGIKQEVLGEKVGIKNKGNFSTRLSDASKFSIEEIEKLSKELEFANVEKFIEDTELFCNPELKEFLDDRGQDACEIKRLNKIIDDHDDEPLDRLSLAFMSFFSGILTTLIIQFLSYLVFLN